MKVCDYPEYELQARKRLRELAATFPTGGRGQLRGQLLVDAVHAELDKLPVVAAEVWLSVHSWQLRMAAKSPTRRITWPWRRPLTTL